MRPQIKDIYINYFQNKIKLDSEWHNGNFKISFRYIGQNASYYYFYPYKDGTKMWQTAHRYKN